MQRTEARQDEICAPALKDEQRSMSIPVSSGAGESEFSECLERLLHEAAALQSELRSFSLPHENSVVGRKLAHNLSNVLMTGRCLQEIVVSVPDSPAREQTSETLSELQQTVREIRRQTEQLLHRRSTSAAMN